jgi:hypothetical protein
MLIRALAALVFVLAAVESVSANGDPSPLPAARYENRLDPPQTVIKRILASDRSDKAKVGALRRFIRLGDSATDVDRRIGGETQVFTTEGVHLGRYCECGLVIHVSNRGNIDAFGYYTGVKYVWLAESAD